MRSYDLRWTPELVFVREQKFSLWVVCKRSTENEHGAETDTETINGGRHMGIVGQILDKIGKVEQRVADIESAYRGEPAIRRRLADLERQTKVEPQDLDVLRADTRQIEQAIKTTIHDVRVEQQSLRVNMQRAFDRVVALENKTKLDDPANQHGTGSVWENIHRLYREVHDIQGKLKQPIKFRVDPDTGNFGIGTIKDISLSEAKQTELDNLRRRLADLEARAGFYAQTPDTGYTKAWIDALWGSKVPRINRFRASGSTPGEKARHYFIEDTGHRHSWQQRISCWGYDAKLRDRIIDLLNTYGYED